MKPFLNITAIGAMLCTIAATLTACVFCMAGGANSPPAQIHTLKLWMLGCTLGGAFGIGIGIGIGICLLRLGLAGWSTTVAILPAVTMGLILIIKLNRLQSAARFDSLPT